MPPENAEPTPSPAPETDPSAASQTEEVESAPAAEATTSSPSEHPTVLAVDDEEHILKMLHAYLSENRIEMRTAASGEEGLEKLDDQVDLMLVDLKMAGMSGIEMITTARKRGWMGKVIILTGYPAKDTIVQAAHLHVADYVTKPFVPSLLLERIEEALQVQRGLHETSATSDMSQTILDPAASVPVFVPGELELSLDVLEELAKNAMELLHQGAVLPARDYYVVNDTKKVGKLENREPTLKSNQRMDEGCIKALTRIFRDEYAGLVDRDGNEMRSVWVQKNQHLGDHLTVAHPFDAKRYMAKLKPHPLCSHVLQLARKEVVQATLTAVSDAWRHHEVAFLMHHLATKKNHRLSNHLMTTSFLAVMNAHEELTRTVPDFNGDNRRVVLAIMAVCATLHDIGLSLAAEEPRFGSQEHLSLWKQHPNAGYSLMRNAPIYSEVKMVVRDHHKYLLERNSRYDSYTRIVQLASDLDQLVQGDAVVMGKSGPEIRRSPVAPLEACRTVVLRSQQGVYAEGAVEGMLTDCQFQALVNYYKQLKEMRQRPCKSLILSPNSVNPITALCRYGAGRAASHRDKPYCDDCSGKKSHSFRGSFYHRCMLGHQEISDLNLSIKHLSGGGGAEADTAPQAAQEDATTADGAGSADADEAGDASGATAPPSPPAE